MAPPPLTSYQDVDMLTMRSHYCEGDISHTESVSQNVDPFMPIKKFWKKCWKKIIIFREGGGGSTPSRKIPQK